MPTLAGWLTGEQTPQEAIEQVLAALQTALEHNGGEPAQALHPGAGLLTFADPAYAVAHSHDPPILDWMPDRHTLVYRRPLSGLHPLYYIENWPAAGNLLFASEIKALLALGVPRRLHLPALDALLRYGFIPAPWTAFKGISIVPAGSILRWQRGKTLVNPSTDYHLDAAPAEAETLDQIHTLLDEASTELLPTHNQFISFSGGGASSALATLLATQHNATPPGIATLSHSQSNRSLAWQVLEALAVAQPMLTIDGLDQPEFWIATIAALEAPDIASRSLAAHQLLHTTTQETGARVGISGLGARLLLEDMTPGLVEQAGSNEVERLLEGYQQRLNGDKLAAPWSAEAARQLREEQPWEETQQARRLARQAAKLTDERMRYYYLDLHLRLPDQIVQPLQRLAAQERLALRSPYLSTRVMDALTRLPASLADGTPKREITARLWARFMPQQTGATLALTAPTASLLHSEQSELLQQTLGEQALRATGIFEPEVVAALLKAHKGRAAPHELLLVFTTQLLCTMFEVGM